MKSKNSQESPKSHDETVTIAIKMTKIIIAVK